MHVTKTSSKDIRVKRSLRFFIKARDLLVYRQIFLFHFTFRIWYAGSHILLYIWSTQWSDPCKGHNIPMLHS